MLKVVLAAKKILTTIDCADVQVLVRSKKEREHLLTEHLLTEHLLTPDFRCC